MSKKLEFENALDTVVLLAKELGYTLRVKGDDFSTVYMVTIPNEPEQLDLDEDTMKKMIAVAMVDENWDVVYELSGKLADALLQE